jgi:hypothetical protein
VGRGGGGVGGGVSVSLPLPESLHVPPTDPTPPPFDDRVSYKRPRCLFFLNVCVCVCVCMCAYACVC